MKQTRSYSIFSLVTHPWRVSPLRSTALLGASIALAPLLQAQTTQRKVDSYTVPDAPSAVLAGQQSAEGRAASRQATGQSSVGGQSKQTKRILGVFPNFRAVSADTELPAQTATEKFKSAEQQTFDYSDLPLALALAGVDQAEDSVPAFHQGATGYARYFWHITADQVDENFWVQAILPSVLHQDARYYTLGRGGIARRALYAADRTLITRSDSGNERFNYSEVVGSGTAAGISYLYYPNSEKNWTKTGQRWLENVVIDGATYVFQEFWPDINDKLFHIKG